MRLSDSMMMTDDSGQSFRTILPPIGAQLSAFLLAGDGTLYAGTRTGKLYVLPPERRSSLSKPRLISDASGSDPAAPGFTPAPIWSPTGTVSPPATTWDKRSSE